MNQIFKFFFFFIFFFYVHVFLQTLVLLLLSLHSQQKPAKQLWGVACLCYCVPTCKWQVEV